MRPLHQLARSLMLSYWLVVEASSEHSCQAQIATEFSLTYGEPLLAWEKMLKPGLALVGPNEMVTSTGLASAVVRPNFDTLYMNLAYDISRGDVELTIPKFDSDRFWSASFYTPYGDNYLNFGAIDSAPAGTFLLTVVSDGNSSETLGAGRSPWYKGTIFSPQTIGFLLIRILVRNTTADIAAALQIQRGISARFTTRTNSSSSPALSPSMFANTSNSQADHILKLTALYEGTIPSPDGVALSTLTVSNLSLGGITTDGQYRTPGCVNLSTAYTEVNSEIGNFYKGSRTPLGNGWSLPKFDEIGRYGTNYLARASVARWAYLALSSDVAIYPFYDEVFSLQPNESYTLRFSQKPPLGRFGFWSITLYDVFGYRVDNPIGRYALGDRSDIAFANGAPVYGGKADGAFEILVQAAQPAENWTSNWLPSPATQGNFDLLLRFYVPQAALLNGSYQYPTVTKGPLK